MNLVNWKKKVENVTFQLRPGDPWPSSEGTPTMTASDMPSETAETPNNHDTSAPSDRKRKSGGIELSDGVISGIAIDGAMFLALAGVLIFYCGRRGIKIVF